MAPRDPKDDTPTHGARVVMREVERLPVERRIEGFRVAYKMNDKGEHVVAFIYPPQKP